MCPRLSGKPRILLRAPHDGVFPRLRRVPGSRRGGPPRARARTAPRRARSLSRASGATYDEVFDGATGQMIQTLSQSTETVSAGGLEWSYRLGVPEEGVEAQPHKVVLVHGAGLLAFTYSKLMRELQTQGYVCVAPDMPGHGATSKPPPASATDDFPRAERAFGISGRAGARIGGVDSPIDLVVSGVLHQPSRAFCSPPRTRIACAACACSTRRSGTATSSPTRSRCTAARLGWARARTRTCTSWRTSATSSRSTRSAWVCTRHPTSGPTPPPRATPSKPPRRRRHR